MDFYWPGLPRFPCENRLRRSEAGAVGDQRARHDGMAAFSGRHKPVVGLYLRSTRWSDATGMLEIPLSRQATAALAAGASVLDKVAHLANYAGGLVVMKRGTATVTAQELLATLEQPLPTARPH